MRIEIFAGAINPLQEGLSNLHSNISATIESLQSSRRAFYNMSGGVANLSNAVASLDNRIRTEERKLEAVSTLSRKTSIFLNNTITTDAQVARIVAVNQEKFFNQYSWLRPVVPEEKSWWEKRVENWNNFWHNAGETFQSFAEEVVDFADIAIDFVKDTVKNVFNTVTTFIKEHWVELAIGAAAIIIGAAAFVFTGGGAAALGIALLSGFKAAAISAVIDGTINVLMAWLTGGDAGKAFGDGLASGFMMGGIFFALGSIISGVRSALSAKKGLTPSERFDISKKQGKNFSDIECEKFHSRYPMSDREITIETVVDGKKAKFRIDQMGYDERGNLILREMKSSPTAPLTKQQKLTWGKNVTSKSRFGILENGGVVKGRVNKELFPGGFQIPSGTKIQIVRPPTPFKYIERLNKITKFTIYPAGVSGIISNSVKNINPGSSKTEEEAYVY